MPVSPVMDMEGARYPAPVPCRRVHPPVVGGCVQRQARPPTRRSSGSTADCGRASFGARASDGDAGSGWQQRMDAIGRGARLWAFTVAGDPGVAASHGADGAKIRVKRNGVGLAVDADLGGGPRHHLYVRVLADRSVGECIECTAHPVVRLDARSRFHRDMP